ncbi:MAG: cell division protein FtsZ [Bacteroidales bacterium]|nr:cell division protein FtsZ [Bacteroidales bacterium]
MAEFDFSSENKVLNFSFETKKNIIKVLGVGGGGGNAVGHMYEYGIKDVDFIVANTDNQVLEVSKIPSKIQLGETVTQGLGAGNNPENGKEAATESIELIRSALVDNRVTKMLFITAGMGGGTGTGAAPVIAKLAKEEMGILTVAIVTIPFRFEGPKRVRQALKGLEELASCVDSMLVIDNEKINDIYGDLALDEAFLKADDILTMAAKGIAEIITVTGSINVDFADVNTVMKDSGIALMGTGKAEGEGRALKAVQTALDSPLLNNNDIKGAKKLLLNISSSDKAKASMKEVTAINDYVQSRAGNKADLIWGSSFDQALDKNICVTLIATGFNAKEILNPYETESGYRPKNDGLQIEEANNNYAAGAVVDLEVGDSETPSTEESENVSEQESGQDETPLTETVDKIEEQPVVEETPDEEDDEEPEIGVEVPIPTSSFQNIDFTVFRENEISEYENTPAYVRKNVKLNIGNYKGEKYQKFQLV